MIRSNRKTGEVTYIGTITPEKILQAQEMVVKAYAEANAEKIFQQAEAAGAFANIPG